MTEFNIGDRVRATQDIPHATLPEIILAEAGEEGSIIRGNFTSFGGTAVIVQFDKDDTSRSNMFEPIDVKYLELIEG